MSDEWGKEHADARCINPIIPLTVDLGECVRFTKARLRFLRAVAAAALAVTSSEAVRLREGNRTLLSMSLELTGCIAVWTERYREDATILLAQSSVIPAHTWGAEEAEGDVSAVIIVVCAEGFLEFCARVQCSVQ